MLKLLKLWNRLFPAVVPPPISQIVVQGKVGEELTVVPIVPSAWI